MVMRASRYRRPPPDCRPKGPLLENLLAGLPSPGACLHQRFLDLRIGNRPEYEPGLLLCGPTTESRKGYGSLALFFVFPRELDARGSDPGVVGAMPTACAVFFWGNVKNAADGETGGAPGDLFFFQKNPCLSRFIGDLSVERAGPAPGPVWRPVGIFLPELWMSRGMFSGNASATGSFSFRGARTFQHREGIFVNCRE